MVKEAATTSREVGPSEAAQRAAQGAELIDVRTDEEWDGARIPGATHVRLEELAARAGELDPSADLVIYCRTGSRSSMAAEALAHAGFNAVNLAGGIKAWVEAGLEVEPPDGEIP
jgi:rhodanese-related sulfurtransferase